MHYISATEVRNNFSKTIDMAQRQPVVIQKQGRDVAVVLSPEDFERVTRYNKEQLVQSMRTLGRQAQKRGLTKKILKEIIAHGH